MSWDYLPRFIVFSTDIHGIVNIPNLYTKIGRLFCLWLLALKTVDMLEHGSHVDVQLCLISVLVLLTAIIFGQDGLCLFGIIW